MPMDDKTADEIINRLYEKAKLNENPRVKAAFEHQALTGIPVKLIVKRLDDGTYDVEVVDD